MRLKTPLSADEYVREFYRQMGSFTSFGDERFTGFFAGHFFSVCYHSGWEWNRKLTNEKNRAIGYVRNTPEGTEVRFVHLYGDSNPISLALLFLTGFLAAWLIVKLNSGPYMDSIVELMISSICGLFVMVSVVLETVIASYFTERGQYGTGVLMAYLKNPKDPWH